MSLEKTEAKLNMAHELGVRFDDILESVTKEIDKAEGGLVWLNQAINLILNMKKTIEEQLAAGTQGIPDAKDLIAKVHESLKNLLSRANTEKHMMVGKADALKAVVTMTKRTYDVEQAKLNAILQQVREQEAVEAAAVLATEVVDTAPVAAQTEKRATGKHPGASLKTRRIASEKVKKKAKSK
jgi:hypothetical protein